MIKTGKCATALSGFLQLKISFIVFRKIQGFHFRRHALAGVIIKLSACLGGGYHAFFDTKNGVTIQVCGILAVAAGTGDFFTEQHLSHLKMNFFILYTMTFLFSSPFFDFLKLDIPKCQAKANLRP
jgi:hypothetical protein